MIFLADKTDTVTVHAVYHDAFKDYFIFPLIEPQNLAFKISG